MFDEIYKEFENTNDINKFYTKHSLNKESTKFLLIRSLDKEDLKELYLKVFSEEAPSNFKDFQYYKSLFESKITIKELLNYIESKREIVLKNRKGENAGLIELINDFDIVNCGIETDKVDDIVKRVVRDKSIKTKEQFEEKLNNGLLPKIANYVRWSFYNQITNDVIEEIFLENEKVIPTLRKIHDIDFFVKIGSEIIPFDLKITHISSEFFDLYHKGIVESDGDDNYITSNGLKEIEEVKEFYKKKKQEYNLPGYGGKTIQELFDILNSTGDIECTDFVSYMYREREKAVLSIEKEIKKLEWWNYKYQGPRLFMNNNRWFLK